MVRGDRQISRSEETGGSVEIRDTGGFSRGMRVRGSGGEQRRSEETCFD